MEIQEKVSQTRKAIMDAKLDLMNFCYSKGWRLVEGHKLMFVSGKFYEAMQENSLDEITQELPEDYFYVDEIFM